ncbi:hypothetical protein GALL_07210 [mine drainage metagenome]|uniref:Lipoprotein n=1 Tax=mine drainage metagenome TaxID=410659 RepID=A0A1J5TTR1_9ZZZZ
MRYLLVWMALLLTACDADPARNMYEGIKSNNDAKRTPDERAMAPAPSYDEYKKERDAQSAR